MLNKRQVKHTSTVLESSIPFHTLVKLIDAKAIANDKFKTHDLALELNNITNQLQNQTLDSSQQEQLMFTQPRDHNKKNKPAYKKPCSYCHRTYHSISACFEKQRDDEDKKRLMLDRNLLKNHLYSTFVLLQMIEQKDMIHVFEVEVIHKIIITTKILTHRTDIALHLEIDLVMTKTLLLRNTHDRDITTIKEIHVFIALITDLLTDLLTGMTLVTDIDHVHTQEITTSLQDTHLPIDHLHNQGVLDILDYVHISIQETKFIQYNHNTKMAHITLKYTCIIQLKLPTR